MVSGIQLIGIFFALIQGYFTFLHFKRHEFTVREFLGWELLWLVFLAISLFPYQFTVLTGGFGPVRPLDVFYILGFIVVLSISFYTYVNLDRLRKKMEKAVRDLALTEEHDSQKNKEVAVCVIGLGYVGLPLAVAFGRSGMPTTGFDVKVQRVEELKEGVDSTGELSQEELGQSGVRFTADESALDEANFLIIAVPTPVNRANQPDLSILEEASRLVGRHLRRGTTVVYESTVYPGATEEVCLPILESVSGLRCGPDFAIGYSPERINPGDREHTLERIVKVVSGMDAASREHIAAVYGTVCAAGVYQAESIKTAEAAKVIENTQRDLNIALINELSLIFHRVGIDTDAVLRAAGTKWNFLPFRPGLVGGHCIGVDPYYLVHKAEELGYHPQVITAGRRVNDFMPEFVAQELVRGMIAAGKIVQKSRVLVLGLTFKENVTDLRNSKITQSIQHLQELGVEVIGFDPLLSAEEIERTFAISSISELSGQYDAAIVATPHRILAGRAAELLAVLSEPAVVMDVTGLYRKELSQEPRIRYACL